MAACKTADNSSAISNSNKEASKIADDNNYDDVLDDDNEFDKESDLEPIDKESNRGLIEEMFDRIDQGQDSISANVNNLIQNVDIDKEITVLENVINESEENSDTLSTEVKSSDVADAAIEFWDNTVSVLEDQKSLSKSISAGDGSGPDADSYTKKVDDWKDSYNKARKLLK